MKSLQFITQVEWNNYWKKNKGLKLAWESLSPFMRLRARSGITRWVFMWGWAACERHYQGVLEGMDQRIAESAKKMEEDYIKEWNKRTKTQLL